MKKLLVLGIVSSFTLQASEKSGLSQEQKAKILAFYKSDQNGGASSFFSCANPQELEEARKVARENTLKNAAKESKGKFQVMDSATLHRAQKLITFYNEHSTPHRQELTQKYQQKINAYLSQAIVPVE